MALVFQYGSNCSESQINSKDRLCDDAKFVASIAKSSFYHSRCMLNERPTVNTPEPRNYVANEWCRGPGLHRSHHEFFTPSCNVTCGVVTLVSLFSKSQE